MNDKTPEEKLPENGHRDACIEEALGGITPEGESAWEEQLQNDPALAAEWEELARITELLRAGKALEEEQAPAPMGLTADQRDRLLATQPDANSSAGKVAAKADIVIDFEPQRRSGSNRRPWAMAAILLVILAVSTTAILQLNFGRGVSQQSASSTEKLAGAIAMTQEDAATESALSEPVVSSKEKRGVEGSAKPASAAPPAHMQGEAIASRRVEASRMRQNIMMGEGASAPAASEVAPTFADAIPAPADKPSVIDETTHQLAKQSAIADAIVNGQEPKVIASADKMDDTVYETETLYAEKAEAVPFPSAPAPVPASLKAPAPLDTAATESAAPDSGAPDSGATDSGATDSGATDPFLLNADLSAEVRDRRIASTRSSRSDSRTPLGDPDRLVEVPTFSQRAGYIDTDGDVDLAPEELGAQFYAAPDSNDALAMDYGNVGKRELAMMEASEVEEEKDVSHDVDLAASAAVAPVPLEREAGRKITAARAAGSVQPTSELRRQTPKGQIEADPESASSPFGQKNIPWVDLLYTHSPTEPETLYFVFVAQPRGADSETNAQESPTTEDQNSQEKMKEILEFEATFATYFETVEVIEAASSPVLAEKLPRLYMLLDPPNSYNSEVHKWWFRAELEQKMKRTMFSQPPGIVIYKVGGRTENGRGFQEEGSAKFKVDFDFEKPPFDEAPLALRLAVLKIETAALENASHDERAEKTAILKTILKELRSEHPEESASIDEMLDTLAN